MNKYLVKISNVKALNLSLNNETNSPIDPYVKFHFNQNKKFKTETLNKTVNANFKFETTFYYQTRLDEKLESRHLEIEVFDACIIGSDKFVGAFSISFATIVNGPVHHRVVIRNHGKPNGTVEFDMEMAQVNETLLTLKNIRANFYPGSLSPMDAQIEKFLSYYINDPAKQSDQAKRTLKSKKNVQTSWDDVDQIIVDTSLQQLLANPIVFTVHQSRAYNASSDPAYGQASVSLVNYVTSVSHIADNCKVGFVEPIMYQQMVVGALEGDIYFHNAPLTCQMVGGVHTDVGIQDAQPFFSQLRNNTTNTFSTTATGATANVEAVSVATATATSTSEQALPEGWEKRVDPSGKVYYVDHNTKTSSWELPTFTSPVSTPAPVTATSAPITVSSSLPTTSPISISSTPSQPSTVPNSLPAQLPVQIPTQQPIQPTQQPQQPIQPIAPIAPTSVLPQQQQQRPPLIQPVAPSLIGSVPQQQPQQIKPVLPQPTYLQPGVQLQYTMGPNGQPYAAPSYVQPPAAAYPNYPVGAYQMPQVYPAGAVGYPQQGYTYAYRSSSNSSSCHGHHHCH